MVIQVYSICPPSPEQNPVEDVWLQTKNFLRRCWFVGVYFNFRELQHGMFGAPELLQDIQASLKL
jgi:transposase